MSRFVRVAALVPLIDAAPLPAQQAPVQRWWDTLPPIVHRVDVATVDTLPLWLRQQLSRRHCLIPQIYNMQWLMNDQYTAAYYFTSDRQWVECTPEFAD